MILSFGDCELDTDRLSLSRGGQPVTVEPQVFDLIRLLVENPNRVVTRDEIIEVVWSGRIVSESAISARIASARKAVGDDGTRQAVIRTIHRRGLQIAIAVAVADATRPVSLPTAPKVRYAITSDGASLAYAVGGNGPPVATVSYFMSDVEKEMHTRGFHEEYDAIMGQNTLLRYDQRGAGLSLSPIDQVDFGDFAEDLRAILDTAKLGKVALLAKSSGTMTALTFARRYPDRVQRIAVVGGYVDGRVRRATGPEPSPDAIRAIVAEGWQDPDSVFMSAYMKAYFPDGPEDVVQTFAAYVQRNTSRENMLTFRDAVDRASVCDCLPHIRCPVLVIHARHNRVHPLSEAQKMTAGLAHAELVVLESGNDMPLPGHPSWDTYLDALLPFLAD